MSNLFVGLVNLQLVSTRHHLSLLLEETTASDRIRNRGLLESAAWHLRRAYDVYLCEVGANYKLPAPQQNNTATALCEALEKVDKHPGEASELQKLERTGWLSDLILALRGLDSTTSGGVTETQPAPIKLGELKVVDLDNRAPELTEESVRQWLSAFKELIERQREVMIEC